MTFFRFLFTKTFLKQVAVALVLLVVMAFAMLYWLDYKTNHDQHIEVPDLSKMSLDKVEEQVDALNLRIEILDSANYNPDFPKYSVIDQIPEAGKNVKENRKIYITLNPSGYRKVEIPPLVGKTLRQAEPTLRSLGFEIGEKSYKPHIAEDEVLEMQHKGKELKAGEELQITSVIDLVLGDGEKRYGQKDEDDEDDNREEDATDEETGNNKTDE